MDFEKESLGRYLEAMCEEQPELDYSPDWLQGLRVDFYFPQAKIGICYGDTEINAALQAPKNKRIAKHLKKNKITLLSFSTADICRERILAIVPSLCSGHRIHRNEKEIQEIMTRFIKTVMVEIEGEAPDFSAWQKEAEEHGFNPAEEPENSELDTEDEVVTINSGEISHET